MAKKPTKQLSRRDALKLLGTAAGGSMLAALPPKWTSPRVTPGSLPPQGATSPVLPDVVTNTPYAPGNFEATFYATLNSDGGCAVTDRGFVWDHDSNPLPTLGNTYALKQLGGGTVGPFQAGPFGSGTIPPLPNADDWLVRAYATNCAGTAYGASQGFSTLCLAEGTFVELADGTRGPIEQIEYTNLLRIWNFDDARFDAAPPLWIKEAENLDRHSLLEFSDGSWLKTTDQHRIFNRHLGMFTYAMTEDSPIGTATFNASGHEVTLVRKSVIREPIRTYNIITVGHMNMFTNGILTSCRYNNIYPIVDMRFVKDGRALRPREEYGVADRFYTGLRLAEQTISAEDTFAYVRRLESLEVQPELVAA